MFLSTGKQLYKKANELTYTLLLKWNEACVARTLVSTPPASRPVAGHLLPLPSPPIRNLTTPLTFSV